MTALEKIKTEYMLYELEAIPKNTDETLKVIGVFIDDMDESISSSEKAVSENIRYEQIVKFKNFFLDLLGYEGEDIEQFRQDNDIILKHSSLADRYKKYFLSMKEIVSDDNYVEVCKLAMFTYQSYTGNHQYLESVRDSIKFASQGIIYYSNSEDTQGEFLDFFESVFPGIKNSEKIYKK